MSDWGQIYKSWGWTKAIDLSGCGEVKEQQRLDVETHSVHRKVDPQGVVKLVQELHKTISLRWKKRKKEIDFNQLCSCLRRCLSI